MGGGDSGGGGSCGCDARREEGGMEDGDGMSGRTITAAWLYVEGFGLEFLDCVMCVSVRVGVGVIEALFRSRLCM